MAIRRLFFDIETSPCLGWFWRPGFQTNLNYGNVIENAKIICICYKWSHQDKVYYLKWDKTQCDKKILEKFISVMDKADEVIGHNSDRFDTKWLRTRAMFHNIDMIPDYKSIDTLKQARQLLNMPSNRLDSIGKYFELGQKLENETDLWHKVWRENNQAALMRMVKYCKQDVVLLEQFFNKLNKYIKPKSHTTGLKQDCPECGSDNVKLWGFHYSPSGTKKQRCRCNDCGKNFSYNEPKKKVK
jgi:DNA polymerase elongation subunit (family B)